jgi:hypothetical protein
MKAQIDLTKFTKEQLAQMYRDAMNREYRRRKQMRR